MKTGRFPFVGLIASIVRLANVSWDWLKKINKRDRQLQKPLIRQCFELHIQNSTLMNILLPSFYNSSLLTIEKSQIKHLHGQMLRNSIAGIWWPKKIQFNNTNIEKWYMFNLTKNLHNVVILGILLQFGVLEKSPHWNSKIARLTGFLQAQFMPRESEI